MFKGANPNEFRQHLGDLYKALSGKSSEHMLIEFK